VVVIVVVVVVIVVVAVVVVGAVVIRASVVAELGVGVDTGALLGRCYRRQRRRAGCC
jgi:hypothetical protein